MIIINMIIVAMLLTGWAWIADMLLGNFEEDLATLPTGRKVALICVLVIFAPVFFWEELLEIIVDIIIDGEEEE
jgi:hypothetical protein